LAVSDEHDLHRVDGTGTDRATTDALAAAPVTGRRRGWAVHFATVTPGWFPDPSGRFEFRYFNGRSWTADVATDGARYIDAGADRAQSPAPPASRGRGGNGLATAAFVCGLVALTICWLPVIFVGGFALAVVALVLGGVALRRSAGRDGAGRGFALAGVMTGGVAVVGSAGGLLLTFVAFDALERYEDPGPTTVIIRTCSAADGRIVVEGDLRNDGTAAADYAVVYEVRRAGTDDVVLRVREPVRDVAAGATAVFGAVDRTTVDSIECEIVDVTGPLPFGIAP
jgi:hypothetical protein